MKRRENLNINKNSIPKVLMIGTDINSLGGISSVIKLYKEFWSINSDLLNLSSYKDGNIFSKLLFYTGFLVKFIFILIKDKNINIVHIHTASRGSFLRKSAAFYIAKIFNKKILLHIHGAEFTLFYKESSDFLKQIITNILNNADIVLVLSEDWKNNILNLTENNNVSVLYNPAVLKDICRAESESINVLFMGRLGQRKGVYDIIEAAKHIKNHNVKISLYGDGNLNEFENLVKYSGLQDKVKIGGWISGFEKDKIFMNSDIFILPSYSEGLPVSVLEAISAGLPVVSTPVGGIPEAVKDGVNGFMIQAGDYKTLAEKIDMLAEDKDLRENMGKQSRQKAKEKFDIKIIMNQLGDIYDELLK